MLNPDEYEYGDLKFFYSIHVARQKSMGENPLKYDQFIKRLRVMNLHDAIYTPRTKEVKPRKSKTPIQDHIRRTQKLKEADVHIDFDSMKEVERRTNKRVFKPKPVEEKPSLWIRFIRLFKR